MSKTVTLFLSWGGLVWAVYEGKITAADMKGALYFFDGDDPAVLTDGWASQYVDQMQEVYDEEKLEKLEKAISIVQPVVREADSEIRVGWGLNQRSFGWRSINEFLSSNGIDSIEVPKLPGGRLSHYSHSALKKAVEDQGLALRVISSLK